ncbi:MAG: hypothetical protein ACI8RD_004764 [Bacillariaceae sp.]|jgi:hypothetical protein
MTIFCEKEKGVSDRAKIGGQHGRSAKGLTLSTQLTHSTQINSYEIILLKSMYAIILKRSSSKNTKQEIKEGYCTVIMLI